MQPAQHGRRGSVADALSTEAWASSLRDAPIPAASPRSSSSTGRRASLQMIATATPPRVSVERTQEGAVVRVLSPAAQRTRDAAIHRDEFSALPSRRSVAHTAGRQRSASISVPQDVRRRGADPRPSAPPAAAPQRRQSLPSSVLSGRSASTSSMVDPLSITNRSAFSIGVAPTPLAQTAADLTRRAAAAAAAPVAATNRAAVWRPAAHPQVQPTQIVGQRRPVVSMASSASSVASAHSPQLSAQRSPVVVNRRPAAAGIAAARSPVISTLSLGSNSSMLDAPAAVISAAPVHAPRQLSRADSNGSTASGKPTTPPLPPMLQSFSASPPQLTLDVSDPVIAPRRPTTPPMPPPEPLARRPLTPPLPPSEPAPSARPTTPPLESLTPPPVDQLTAAVVAAMSAVTAGSSSPEVSVTAPLAAASPGRPRTPPLEQLPGSLTPLQSTCAVHVDAFYVPPALPAVAAAIAPARSAIPSAISLPSLPSLSGRSLAGASTASSVRSNILDAAILMAAATRATDSLRHAALSRSSSTGGSSSGAASPRAGGGAGAGAGGGSRSPYRGPTLPQPVSTHIFAQYASTGADGAAPTTPIAAAAAAAARPRGEVATTSRACVVDEPQPEPSVAGRAMLVALQLQFLPCVPRYELALRLKVMARLRKEVAVLALKRVEESSWRAHL